MDNPKTLATVRPEDTGIKKQNQKSKPKTNTTQKTKAMGITHLTKIRG
jgi:hypothetical protein